MRVLISGASGMIGRALTLVLAQRGDEVTALSRSGDENAAPTVIWNPDKGVIDAAALEAFDAVVHLAGENISSGRWTPEKKDRIRDSRIEGTRLLCTALAGLANKPRVVVAASATGYYGDRGDTVLTETSGTGRNFIADVCREWEAATEPCSEAGIRVVNPRIGVVLDSDAGALKKMLPAFRWGLGGRIGNGGQYMAWISLRDLAAALTTLIDTEGVSGAVNIVAPNPVTNSEFTKALGRALRRPTLLPIPAFMIRSLFGQMGRELLLSSQRVVPMRLIETGFRFEQPTIDEAFAKMFRTA